MKRILTGLTLSAALASPALSFWNIGEGTMTCAEMTQQHDQWAIDGRVSFTQQWIFGFFTGMNYQTDSNVGRGKEKALYAAVLKYCRENPLDDLWQATIDVYRQLD